ncbi:hypothetical protein COY05_03260 [Candidatus Peregrinibacteria bacterium CG_4_10_14_0_2_um_filter_38_24]|nr:MAG: hypothetical protein COY05_03260 [Candidatus Peregrinibacteria bacterium CG_4_10_14_0_2_um_filter_38_24]
MFGYKDSGEDKGKFNYIMLKPNGFGIEVGRSLLNDDQEFLYTSEYAKDYFPINEAFDIVMKVKDDIVAMTVNGKTYPPYNILPKNSKNKLTADGKIGFYSEDVAVEVSNIKVDCP